MDIPYLKHIISVGGALLIALGLWTLRKENPFFSRGFVAGCLYSLDTAFIEIRSFLPFWQWFYFHPKEMSSLLQQFLNFLFTYGLGLYSFLLFYFLFYQIARGTAAQAKEKNQHPWIGYLPLWWKINLCTMSATFLLYQITWSRFAPQHYLSTFIIDCGNALLLCWKIAAAYLLWLAAYDIHLPKIKPSSSPKKVV